jgi:hypothetical protein
MGDGIWMQVNASISPLARSWPRCAISRGSDRETTQGHTLYLLQQRTTGIPLHQSIGASRYTGCAYSIVRHSCREWSLLPTLLTPARNYRRRVYKWSLRSSACDRASISYIPDRPTHSPDPTLFSTLAMLVRTPPDPIALPCIRVEVVPSRASGTCCCSSRRYC